MKKFLSVIGYKSAYGVLYFISLVPLPVLYGISSLMYFLAYHVFNYRKSVVIQNISRSFPDKNYKEIQEIVKRFYACFMNYFAEMAKCISISPKQLDTKLTFIGLERIIEPIQVGKNVIICLGHCGNWEMLNYLPQKLACEVYAVYKPLSSPMVNQLMIKLRSRFGMKMIKDQSIVRHLLKKDTHPAAYLFLADQSPRIREKKYCFELLNQSAYHFSGMEKLARISRSAVVYMHILQLEKGHYTIVCIPLCSDAGSINEGEITRKYSERLTQNIREAPHGWLWSHRRWK